MIVQLCADYSDSDRIDEYLLPELSGETLNNVLAMYKATEIR